ncbi:cell division protein ZipA [Microbulbifer sp. A4B17]|uniref:cell division protein ZipA n=1 Tax=Microbulbifer sp. A4B17 TaxID=359370 RepID=UPI000D52C78E|nr:cell division protein ZipA [Microbulbifer sp. A4B17]AWF80789.1 cell division protein ZipA [Microbulbifer sp. A4B17]
MDNWLVTILVVVLLVVVVDGIRRAIMRQRAAVKVSRNLSRAMQSEVKNEADPVSEKAEEEPLVRKPQETREPKPANSELPGQARVVQRRPLEDALHVNRQVQESFISSRKPLAGSNPQRSPEEQGILDLEEQVPTLMESVGEEQRYEPALDEAESLSAMDDARSSEREVAREDSHTDRASQSSGSGNVDEAAPAREVLVINVMAPEGDYFEGNDLLRVMVASGMRFGEMNIFHYHEHGGADGAVIFSLANIVVPGVFDLTQMEEFATPGVSLFLTLPVEGEAIKAFDQLLSTSYKIAELLGGELKDENRSVFTAQTAEHYRQRVVEYQRRRALAMAQS